MTQPQGDYFRFKNTLICGISGFSARERKLFRAAGYRAAAHKNVHVCARARPLLWKAADAREIARVKKPRRKEQLCARTPKSITGPLLFRNSAPAQKAGETFLFAEYWQFNRACLPEEKRKARQKNGLQNGAAAALLCESIIQNLSEV